MSTLASLLETLRSFDQGFDQAPADVRADPRLVRQRNMCQSCGACAQDLIDANQRELKQKNINNGLQRLLDMERIDHDKLKREHQNAQKQLEEAKDALAKRSLEFVLMQKRVLAIINDAAKSCGDSDLEPPRKKNKREDV
jgi:hypothetical protein